MDIPYVCEYIKESVSAIDAAEALGIRMDTHHRAPCPFHGGEHNNLKLYDGNRGYYCFVCHAYGNVIDLVKKTQECEFMEAVRWLNDTFRLGIDTEEKSYHNRLSKARKRAKGDRKSVQNGSIQARKSHAEQRQRETAAGV